MILLFGTQQAFLNTCHNLVPRRRDRTLGKRLLVSGFEEREDLGTNLRSVCFDLHIFITTEIFDIELDKSTLHGTLPHIQIDVVIFPFNFVSISFVVFLSISFLFCTFVFLLFLTRNSFVSSTYFFHFISFLFLLLSFHSLLLILLLF